MFEEMFRRPKHGDMHQIIECGEEHALVIEPSSVPGTKEKAAQSAQFVSEVFCDVLDGYDEQDQQAYRAGYYHGLGIRRGGK